MLISTEGERIRRAVTTHGILPLRGSLGKDGRSKKSILKTKPFRGIGFGDLPALSTRRREHSIAGRGQRTVKYQE